MGISNILLKTLAPIAPGAENDPVFVCWPSYLHVLKSS